MLCFRTCVRYRLRTCMSSLLVAVRLLRADGKLNEPTNGGSRALLLHVLALPAAT